MVPIIYFRAEGLGSTADLTSDFMIGNLCRRAAYPTMIAAIEQSRDEMLA